PSGPGGTFVKDTPEALRAAPRSKPWKNCVRSLAVGRRVSLPAATSTPGELPPEYSAAWKPVAKARSPSFMPCTIVEVACWAAAVVICGAPSRLAGSVSVTVAGFRCDKKTGIATAIRIRTSTIPPTIDTMMIAGFVRLRRRERHRHRGEPGVGHAR